MPCQVAGVGFRLHVLCAIRTCNGWTCVRRFLLHHRHLTAVHSPGLAFSAPMKHAFAQTHRAILK